MTNKFDIALRKATRSGTYGRCVFIICGVEASTIFEAQRKVMEALPLNVKRPGGKLNQYARRISGYVVGGFGNPLECDCRDVIRLTLEEAIKESR